MNDLTPVQTAIYSALTAAPATYPVYDGVPQLAPRPYITIGEWFADPDEELASASTDASVNIETWSGFVTGAPAQIRGKTQSHAMLQFIRARLDGQTIAGTWSCSEENVTLLEDPGSTAAARIYHGIARYRVRIG